MSQFGDSGGSGSSDREAGDSNAKSEFDIDAFGEWIEKMADSTALSRREILERLVADFWTMNELLMDADDPSLVDRRMGRFPIDEADPGDLGDVGADEIITPLDDLQAQIRELRKEITELEETTPQGSAVRELQRRVDAQAQEIETLTDDSDSSSAIEPEALQAQDRVAEFTTSLESLEETQNDILRDQDTLREYVTHEISNAHTVLEYLIMKVEANEASVEDARATQDERSRERERLIALKNRALQEDIQTARCESCETALDIGTLPAPNCPVCAEPFSELRKQPKWFGLTEDTTLVTGTTRAADPGGESGSKASDGSNVANSADDEASETGSRG